MPESQRPESDAYNKEETDQRISAAVDAHNTAENAHGDLRASIAAMNASVKAIELKFGTNVTKNPFNVTFGSLDGVSVTGFGTPSRRDWSSDGRTAIHGWK